MQTPQVQISGQDSEFAEDPSYDHKLPKKKLDLLILFVTSICNSKCRTCFYWSSLNQRGDLTFSELEKLSGTMPEFEDLWLSGGEPFLRPDLAKVICLFCDNNHVRYLRIPTNGLPKENTLDAMRFVLERNPRLRAEIDFSIDGFAATHDKIRGVQGGFEAALQTMQELMELRKSYPNLEIFLNSVICTENNAEILDLGKYFLDNFDLDGHYFQIIRGSPMDEALLKVPEGELKRIYTNAMKLNSFYIDRYQARRRPGLGGKVRGLFWKGGYLASYRMQLANYASHEEWPMSCTAGLTSAVVDYNGDFRICELRQPIANLRNYNMDFGALWNSDIRVREYFQQRRDKCFCTHICFIYNSMKNSKQEMLLDIPMSYLSWKVHGETMPVIEKSGDDSS